MVLENLFQLVFQAMPDFAETEPVAAVHKEVFAGTTGNTRAIYSYKNRVSDIAQATSILSVEEILREVAVCLAIHGENNPLVLSIGFGFALSKCIDCRHHRLSVGAKRARSWEAGLEVFTFVVFQANCQTREGCFEAPFMSAVFQSAFVEAGR